MSFNDDEADRKIVRENCFNPLKSGQCLSILAVMMKLLRKILKGVSIPLNRVNVFQFDKDIIEIKRKWYKCFNPLKSGQCLSMYIGAWLIYISIFVSIPLNRVNVFQLQWIFSRRK